MRKWILPIVLPKYLGAECGDPNSPLDFRCCLCNDVVTERGNNPYPLKRYGLCCNICNIAVVVAKYQAR
jgi:hypothetical protein